MKINKKKSGLLIVNPYQTDGDFIRGYPVVLGYKYLGVRGDSNTNQRSHISELNFKLKTYLKRNLRLLKKYFSPNNLIRICDYFVKSRVSYGLCCFVENNSVMKRINRNLVTHLKGIFRLNNYISRQNIVSTLRT